MGNPWIDITEADYVGHMESPAVRQRPMLNRLLGEALARSCPQSVLLLGCSTGNGLEHVDRTITSHVLAVDINPMFVDQTRALGKTLGLSLGARCEDIATLDIPAGSFDLIHAALVLEYVDWQELLPRVAAGLRMHGMFSVVLQLPHPDMAVVTPTPFTTLRSLESVFSFVDPDVLVKAAERADLIVAERRIEKLQSGKEFAVIHFCNEG